MSEWKELALGVLRAGRVSTLMVKERTMRVEVAGVYMDRSLNDFTRGCLVYLEEEQAKLAPDTHLVALLCDAVRLTREMTQLSEHGIEEARQDVARYRYLKSCAQVSSPGMDGTFYWHILSYLFQYRTRTFDEAIDRARHTLTLSGQGAENSQG